MEEFYLVSKGKFGIENQWLYKSEENARKKFDEIAEEIKKRWGYDKGYYDNDSYTISDNYVEFYDRDTNGSDDFRDFVQIERIKLED